MTEQQYKSLEKGLPHYETARRDYVRNVPKWLTDEIISTYEAASGKVLMNKNSNCSICVLRIYQAVGRFFFEEQAKRLGKQEDTEVKESVKTENKTAKKTTNKSKKTNNKNKKAKTTKK